MAALSASHPAEHEAPHVRVALVCDWLTTPGGAEKVLLQLHRMYPDAPIYTSQYRPKGIDWFLDADVRTGWLNIFPVCLRRFLGVLRQFYFSHLDLSDYDVVISVTGAEAKSVKTRGGKYGGSDGGAEPAGEHAVRESCKDGHERHVPEEHHTCYHLCYCHVPTQYYWQFYDKYLQNPGFGILNPLARLGLKLLVKPLRKADYKAAQRPDQFVTISHHAADQIQKYYHRQAEVIFPPVDEQIFTPTKPKKRSGFVVSCRQVTWKRVDLAIQACLQAKHPLTVIGDGPEHANLVRLAHNSALIKFIPWVDAKQLSEHLQSATAYLFPSLEPFGIAPVEALAAGCPVIAYAEGGSRDIVTPGKNGLLFPEQTVESLVEAIQKFEQTKFNTDTIIKSAAKFSTEKFTQGITKIINDKRGRQ